MLITKVKLSVAVLLTVGLVLAGAAASTRALTAEPEKQAAGKAGGGPEPVRADNPTGEQRGGQATSDSKVRALSQGAACPPAGHGKDAGRAA